MANYLLGSSAERGALNATLDRLNQRQGLKLVGSYGRIAMYCTYNYRPANLSTLPIVALRQPVRLFRSVEVITPGRDSSLPRGIGRTYGIGCPDIDTAYNRFFKQGGRGQAILGPEGEEYQVEWRVLRSQRRTLDGMYVPTLRVGAHLALESLVEAAWSNTPTHHVEDYEQFQDFAEALRGKFPEEFHPEEAYEPFRLAAQAYRQHHDTLLGNDPA